MSNSSSIDLDQLFRSHAAHLRNWLKRRGLPPAECEDLVQEAFLRAHCGKDSFRGEASSLTWLFGIVKRIGGKSLLRTGRWSSRACPDDLLDCLPSHAPSPLEAAELRELIDMLERALELAGAECRRLILSPALEGASGAASSNRCSLKIGTVWVRRHRARKRLRSLLHHIESRARTKAGRPGLVGAARNEVVQQHLS